MFSHRVRLVIAGILFLLITTSPGFVQIQPSPEKLTLHLVGNAHIDLAYRWRWNETVEQVNPETFANVLDWMDREPGLTYAQSQLALYEAVQKNQPALFERIKQKIKEGCWSVVGGQWAEPDAILPGGESFVRQFLVGMEYARDQLGIEPIDIAWVPDSFCGQALTLPQIYAGCGMKYYVFGRGAPGQYRVFWWESPDGSRILAYNIPVGYSFKPNSDNPQRLQAYSQLAGINELMLLYGEGDHGGGPNQSDINGIHQLQKSNDFQKIQYDTPELFLKKLTSKTSDWPVYQGEIGIGTGESGEVAGSWRGSYTSQARVKKRNRDCENLLLTAEKFATIGAAFQRKPLFPRVDFREAWKLVLKNQFHDILPGTSVGDVFDDALVEYEQVGKEGNRLLQFGLEIIGSRIDTRGAGIPLVVYNPHSWTRTDVVKAQIRFIERPNDFVIRDYQGNEVLYQIDSWSEAGIVANVSLLATNIPPVGYKLFRVYPNEKPVQNSALKVTSKQIENEFFLIKWNDYGITSIFDKNLKKEMLAGTANAMQLLGESRSSSWDLMLSGEVFPVKSFTPPQVLTKGPLYAMVQWQDATANSRFKRQLILKAGVPRIDFSMTVDWHDHDQILKLAFPIAIANSRAFFEQPYGVIERQTNGLEWPAQNWVDLSNQAFGMALLNDGKYGFDVKENVIRLSVVRGARDMDPRMDEGLHSFNYALVPHAGNWQTADIFQRALEINHPLVAIQENHHVGNLPDWGSGRINEFSLPSEKSFFKIESDHVLLTAIKVKQGDWSPANIVLRLFETEGRAETVWVHLPAEPREVIETNHIEAPIHSSEKILVEKDRFQVQMTRNKLRSFWIKF
ncbi:alpha-mannosidase [candidate division KSB1 bacterium]|nr:alpha-mannosidase [candidate division KSB1 bacterium]